MMIDGRHYGLTAEQIETRRNYVNASDMPVVMGADDARRLERWQQAKDGSVVDFFEDGVLAPCMGSYTEAFNRAWYEKHCGYEVFAVGERLERETADGTPIGATLDGKVLIGGDQCIWEAKHVGGFQPIEDVAQYYMPQLHMQMYLAGCGKAVLSVFLGSNKHETITVEYDPAYGEAVLQWADWWWAGLQSDTPPPPVTAPAPPAVERVKAYDMTGNNAWSLHAGVYLETRDAADLHKKADKELKALVPDDATEAAGHGVTVKVAKNNSKRISVK